MGETNPQALPSSSADPKAVVLGARFRTKKPVLFGRYELLSRFRVGGMAEVWTAKPLAGGQLLAIKRILPSFTDEADYIAMFRDEARLAQRMSHPNIVATHEVGQLDDQPFLVLDHVHGQTAAALIRKAREREEPVPVAIALQIAIEVCSALEYAHTLTSEHGRPLDIVHRDVSPTNVLIAYDGAVKLIDFGIAKSTEQLMRTQAGLLKGKHGYLSPEQALGENVDARTDLFSLAICIWELLAADRLFEGASDFSSIVRVREATVPPLTERNANVPAPLVAVLERALARDPNDRFGSAAELREALVAIAQESATLANVDAVARYMREAFADELLLESNDSSSEPVAPYEGTGLLDAFDDLEPVSAVSVLAHLPSDDFSNEGERIDTLEVEEIDTASEPVDDLELSAQRSPVHDKLELVRDPDEQEDEDDELRAHPKANVEHPAASAEPIDELDSAATLDFGVANQAALPDALDATTPSCLDAPSIHQTPVDAVSPNLASSDHEADEQEQPEEQTRVVAYRSTESGELDAAAALAARSASEPSEEPSSSEPSAQPSLEGSAAATAATLPGLGSVEWDDEELSTHLYDGPTVAAAGASLNEDEREGAQASAAGVRSPSPEIGAVPRPSIAPFSSRPSLPVSLKRTSIPPGASPSFPPPAMSSSGAPRMSAPPQAMQAWASRPWILPAFIVGTALLIGAALALFQSPAPGTIQLTTRPADARVLFDGRAVSGNLSPFVIANVKAESQHSLEVSRDGYRTWSTRLVLSPRQTLQLPEVALVLVPSSMPAMQAAALPSAPAAQPRTPAAPSASEPKTISALRERVAAPRDNRTRPGAVAASVASARGAKPSAAAPAPRPIASALAPMPATSPATSPAASPATSSDTGMLRINSRPWSQVSVDGRLVGNTPQMSLRLSPGKHTVLLVNPEFSLRKTLTVQIKRGAIVTKIVELAR